MTEAEWLACDRPAAMVDFLAGKVSARKVRLFGVACCRQLEPRVGHDAFRLALEAAERIADGRARKADLERARGAARGWEGRPESIGFAARWSALVLADLAVSKKATLAMARGIDRLVDRMGDLGFFPAADRPLGSALARCIFGHPFRPATVDRSGLAPGVVDLAGSIYEDRAFDRLPILGDALEEAGCGDDPILGHCRGGGPHARGCWVVDLVLGKS